MSLAVYLPLLASMLVAPRAVVMAVRALPDRLRPRYALWLLGVSALLLATASTAALALLAAAAIAQIPVVARVGEWSPEVVAAREPLTLPAGIAAGLVLALVTVRGVLAAARIAHRYLQVVRHSPTNRSVGDVIVLADASPYAVARPRLGRRPGQVLVSSGMWAHLDEGERSALIAHERAHISGHHHVATTVAALAEAVNPLLSPLRRDVVYAVERCADEVAVRSVGDRRLVARAVGQAALLVRGAQTGPPLVGLGMASGPVPRRVSALLLPPPTPRPGRWVGAAALSMVAAASMAAALHAGLDLHALLEVAELRCSAI